MADYLSLFDIDIRHEYFGDLYSLPLRYVPDDGSVRLMHNAGIILKCTANGIAVFCGTERLDLLRKLTTDSETPMMLHFKAYSTDPLMSNYTSTVRVPGSTLHFSNNDAEKKTISVGQYVSSRDFCMNTHPDVHQILNRNDRVNPPFFILSVCVRMSANSASFDSADYKTQRLFLTFRSREVYWQYFLCNPSSLKSPVIKDLDNRIEFEIIDAEGFFEGLVFRSTKMMILTKKSMRRFSLLDGKRVIIKRLPVAAATHLSRENIDGNMKWVSEIYVNR